MTDDSEPESEPAPETETALRAACAASRWHDAATLALGTYGDEILGYLVAMTRDPVKADDAFSLFLENLWRGLPTFGWRSSFRTWAYVIARNSAQRLARDPTRRRAVPLDSSIEEMAAHLRTQTASFLRTENRDAVSSLRAALSPDDQTLLVLRINRGLAWRDIAQVLAGGDEDGNEVPALSDPELTRRSTTLRKRFMRLKDELRERLSRAR